MDAFSKFKEELEKKRKAIEPLKEAIASTVQGESLPTGDKPEKKKKAYLTNGQAKRLQTELSVRTAISAADISGEIDGGSAISGPFSPEQRIAQKASLDGKKTIPRSDVFRRLRELRQPITLFAESDEQRLARLRHVELTRPDLEELDGGQKNFVLEEMKKLKEKGGASSDEEELSAEEKREKKQAKLERLRELEETGRSKEDLIRAWLKRVLHEWDMDLDELPEQVTMSVKGKQEIGTFKQTKIYLRPLFKHLRNKTLEQDILSRLDGIMKSCKIRNYSKAGDEYILLSIGKSAWPMGVTMVGIHERSSREKIYSRDVAHILNDETQRKFIQSVKRIMTYCQNKYPPERFSEALEPTCIDTHAPSMLKQAGKLQLGGILHNK